MISSVGEYLFVTGDNIDTGHPHGDMDRITINGEIMPLRTGNTSSGQPFAKVLRGEDICFLAEGIGERRALNESAASAYTFSRAVKAVGSSGEATPWRIAYGLNTICGSFAGHGFVKTMPTSGTFNVADNDVFEKYTTADLESSTADFTSGHALTQANVLKLFADERKLSTCLLSASNTEGTHAQTVTNSYVAEYPYAPTSTFDGLSWFSGTMPTDLPAHSYGGNACGVSDFTISASMGSSTMPIGDCDAWANFHFHYTAYDSSGTTTTDEDFTYLLNLGHLTRSGSSLNYTISASSLQTLMESVASDRYGWTYGTLPDVYGGKDLRLSSITSWFVLPVTQTKWW